MNKVVFLIRNIASKMYGGGEVYQLKLVEKLRRNGFFPIIVTNSEELLKNAKKGGIKTLVPPYCERQNWSGWKNILLPIYWAYQKKLERWYKKAIKQYSPEVVNIQSRDDWIAATLAAKKYGIRILWTDHADFKNWVLWNVNSRLKNVIGKRIVKLSQYAEKVIFIGKSLELETKKMIAPKSMANSVVIENGVDDELGEYKNVRAVRDNFVFMGRIVKEKGIGELIAAFDKVNKRYPDAKLNVYGDGEGLNKYKELARDNKNICFHGKTDEPLVKMAENEIFVLPSYWEGLSLSLLDAAMMGKKIIASDVDGNPEVVINKKTGLLVPARNVEKLAEAMIYMLDNKKQAEDMAKNVRKLYEEKYNFDKIFVEKMLPLYNSRKEEE